MDKLQFVARQISKASKKPYEHYVVSRIFHQLNDLQLKFVTQQYVSREGGIALTDMFFPQVKLHIEIDEPYHLTRQEEDRLREADIINATKHEIIRIQITNIEDVNARITDVVELIKQKKRELFSSFIPWDIDAEMSPATYIAKGFIDINDDCAFPKIFLAANCFGNNYKTLQRGGAKHPREANKCIWFPKLYSNTGWKNSISHDELEIRESSITDPIAHFQTYINDTRNRIVFAHAKGSLGDTLYRFKGEYRLDVANSSVQKGLLWRRINTRVKTYSLIN